jgi:Peptidase A4 family
MAVVNFPGGLKIILFPPPENLDPFTASSEVLARYGIPKRPVCDEQSLQRWELLMRQMGTYIYPEFGEIRRTSRKPQVRRVGFDVETSPTWSGAVLHAPHGQKFVEVDGNWNVARGTPPTGGGPAEYTAWIGLDGFNDGTGASTDVLQAGHTYIGKDDSGATVDKYHVWFEWFPASEVPITNFPVEPGDGLYARITINVPGDGVATLYFANRTKARWTGFSIHPPVDHSDFHGFVGDCAEWIVERPQLNGVQSSLVNYGEVDFFVCGACLSGGNCSRAFTGNSIDMTDGAGNVISKATLLPNGRHNNSVDVKCVYSGP